MLRRIWILRSVLCAVTLFLTKRHGAERDLHGEKAVRRGHDAPGNAARHFAGGGALDAGERDLVQVHVVDAPSARCCSPGSARRSACS